MDDSAELKKAWNDAQSSLFPSLGLDETDVAVVQVMVKQLLPTMLQMINFVAEAKARAECVTATYAFLSMVVTREIQANAREDYINAEVERIRREAGR